MCFFGYLSCFVCSKARAKHDMTNTVVAGCVTGGAISAKGNTGSILSMVELNCPHFSMHDLSNTISLIRSCFWYLGS